MPATYEPIATQTLSSSASSVTFSSIPGTYTDLVLVISGSASTASNVLARVNSDSSTNYSSTRLFGTGTSVTSNRESNGSVGIVGYSALTGSTGNGICHFMNYSNTTTYKTFISRGNDAASRTMTTVNLWRSTSAISSIEIIPNLGTLDSGYVFTLYGIKAA